MRTASMLEYLRRRYAVEAIVFREPGAPDPAPLFPAEIRVHVLSLSWHSKAIPARALRNIGRFIRGTPPLMDRFSGFSGDVAALVQGRHFDRCFVEHFWCASYANVLRPACDRLILDLHNVESVLLDRSADSESGPLRIMLRRWARASRQQEAHWLPKFDRVLAASAPDAARLKVPSAVYPNTIPLVPLPAPAHKREEIVFSGNLEYQPNQTAVRWFLRDIWPGLRSRRPNLTFRLLGKNDRAVRSLTTGDSRIALTGPVAEAVPSLAESTAAVVPLLSGSGTRIKIIEAWAAGLPVISTSIGAEGLPALSGEHILIADSASDFTEAVVKVLETSVLQRQLGAAGRRLYEEHLTWEAGWNFLESADL